MGKKFNIIAFLNKYKTFLLLGAIGLILFHNYLDIVLIVLLIFLVILALLSVRVTMMDPHISIETITASSILLGYVWGWKIALGFGLIIGFCAYALNGMLKLKTIINILLMGLCGVVAAIFANLHYSFTIAYMLTFLIRLILNNLIFPLVESDWIENMIHSNGDPLFNVLITFQIMNLIYWLLQILRG